MCPTGGSLHYVAGVSWIYRSSSPGPAQPEVAPTASSGSRFPPTSAVFVAAPGNSPSAPQTPQIRYHRPTVSVLTSGHHTIPAQCPGMGSEFANEPAKGNPKQSQIQASLLSLTPCCIRPCTCLAQHRCPPDKATCLEVGSDPLLELNQPVCFVSPCASWFSCQPP